MRKIMLVLALVVAISAANAQMPRAFYYEAALTNSNGQPEQFKDFLVKAELRRDDSDGLLLYAETQSAATRADGTFGIQVGKGASLFGSIGEIDWAYGKICLVVDIDRADGQGWVRSQASMLMPVPYALYSASVEDYWQKDNTTLYYLGGNVGIGTDHPREALELAQDKAVRFSTKLTHLEESGMVKLMWTNNQAKPAITWIDTADHPRAALYAYQYGVGDEPDSLFCIGTSNAAGMVVPRFVMPWGHDVIEMKTVNSDFKVSDGYRFTVGSASGGGGRASFYGDVYVLGKRKFGMGDKDWELEGVAWDASMEIYRLNTNASLLIHQRTGEYPASLRLKSGENAWDIQLQQRLAFICGVSEHFSMLPNGNVGIGNSNPEEKLEVNGNIRIPAGFSYLSGSGDLAVYLEAEERVEPGDVAGLNPASGKIRKFRDGDEVAGIVTSSAAFAGNYASGRENDEDYALVAYKGQLPCNGKNTRQQGRMLYTTDHKLIGVVLNNGKVFLK